MKWQNIHWKFQKLWYFFLKISRSFSPRDVKVPRSNLSITKESVLLDVALKTAPVLSSYSSNQLCCWLTQSCVSVRSCAPFLRCSLASYISLDPSWTASWFCHLSNSSGFWGQITAASLWFPNESKQLADRCINVWDFRIENLALVEIQLQHSVNTILTPNALLIRQYTQLHINNNKILNSITRKPQ